jgi:hypothetical protein
MDEFFRDAISLNVFVNFGLMIQVEAKGIEDLG